MTDIGSKVAHVKAAKQTRQHRCHWPGCTEQVPSAMWGCRKHWYMLPKYIRQEIWRAYQAGQEETIAPSAKYIDAARAAQDWITQNYNRA